MSDLFSTEWLQQYQDLWNQDRELVEALASIQFDSVIGYGFKGDPSPRGCIEVKQGEIIRSTLYTDQPLNWDLRARTEDWQHWLEKGLNLITLGAAYMSGKLQFAVGDYNAMIKDPRMVGPFIKTFAVMGRVRS